MRSAQIILLHRSLFSLRLILLGPEATVTLTTHNHTHTTQTHTHTHTANTRLYTTYTLVLTVPW